MSEDNAWAFLQLDEKQARRSGMPPQVPVRKKEFEGVADGGLTAALAKKSITAFLGEVGSAWRNQNAPLAARFDAYVGKATFTDRAEAAMKKGDHDAAISALNMVTRLDKEDHGARMNLAVALMRKTDYAGARKHLEAVEDTFEGDADYHCVRGQILVNLEDSDGALEQFVLALEADPESKVAMEALVRMGALVAIYENPRDATSLAYVRSDSIAEHLRSVWEEAGTDAAGLLEALAYHESERRWDVALAAADALLAKEGATEAQRQRAETARIAALRSGKANDRALADARTLVATRDSAAARVELARCLLASEDEAGAREELDRALALDPGDILALDLRFWPADHDALVDIQAMLPTLTAFAEKHPSAAGAQRSVARARLAMGAVDDALALFAKAVELDPTNDDLRAELWTELSRAGRDAEVIADAERLGDMKTRSWGLRWNEAESYGRLGKKMEAHAAFGAISQDESLIATLRKRARRAGERVMGG